MGQKGIRIKSRDQEKGGANKKLQNTSRSHGIRKGINNCRE